jgi:hypothetical protein
MSVDLEDRLASQEEAVANIVLGALGRAGRSRFQHAALAGRLVRMLVDAMLRRLGPDAELPGQDGNAFRALGSEYARRRIPLAALLGELQLTAVTASRRWWSVTGPEDVERMFDLGQVWNDAVVEIRAAVEEGYCRELTTTGNRAAARQNLAAEMLAGRSPSPLLVDGARVRLSQHYAVLCCMPGAVPPAGHSWEGLLSGPLGSADILAVEREGRLLVLVPAPAIAPERREQAARDLFAAVGAALDVEVVGVALTPADDVPAAVARAAHVLDLGLTRGATGVMLVGALTAPAERPAGGGRRPAAGSVLHGLAEWPVLVETLRVLHRFDLDIGRTAEAMRTSRRTITRRLDRVRLITGLDPLSSAGRQEFLAALVGRAAAPRTA